MAQYSMEADEAFARQLQAQETGFAPDIQTPLMLNQQQPQVFNARLNDLTSARATVIAILSINVPQILAALVILSIHWNDHHVCDEPHRQRWRWWAALSAFRLLVYSVIVVVMHASRQWLEARPQRLMQMTNARNVTDALGLIWFVVGNMWLFGGDDTCSHPERSPVYGLCVAMLVVNYAQICLPCILAVTLIPLFCICMPCLIRILARLQDPVAGKGANEEAIENLPLVTIGTGNSINSSLNTTKPPDPCPICLSEFVEGEYARVLPCLHMFHKMCVDEWLKVNASCPTCRQSIFMPADEEKAGAVETKAVDTERTRLIA